jgi:cellulose synthase/poly-beta-1,6-N-acetylglucosamine synthase-like glycosyltransferase
MNDEQVKKMLEDTYDESRENTLRSMLKEFYNRKMLSVVILVWIGAVIFIAGAVYTGIQFFNTDQTQRQIMFAAIFIVCWQVVGQLKTFAWLMIHKNSIKREIKRLEFRIVELSDIMKSK